MYKRQNIYIIWNSNLNDLCIQIIGKDKWKN